MIIYQHPLQPASHHAAVVCIFMLLLSLHTTAQCAHVSMCSFHQTFMCWIAVYLLCLCMLQADLRAVGGLLHGAAALMTELARASAATMVAAEGNTAALAANAAAVIDPRTGTMFCCTCLALLALSTVNSQCACIVVFL